MRLRGFVFGATLAVALLPLGTPGANASEKAKVQESAGDKGGAASSKAGKGHKAGTTGRKRDTGWSGKIIPW